jgi:hypothetical protein
MGHLSGAAGFSTGDYGFAAGNDLGLTPATGFQGFVAEATDGAALYNTPVRMYDGSDLRYELGESGFFLYPVGATYPSLNGLNWLDTSDQQLASVVWSRLSDDGRLDIISDFDPDDSIGTGSDSIYLNAGTGADVGAIWVKFDYDSNTSEAGFLVDKIDADDVYMGLGVSPSTAAQLDVVSGAAGRHALRLKAAASPTVPVLEVEDASAARVFAVSGDHVIQLGSSFIARYNVPSGLNGGNTLRIELTRVSNAVNLTRIDLHVGRGGAVTLWGTLTGFIAWNGTDSGSGAVRDNQLRAYGQGASGSITTSGITNGIRIDVTFTGLTNDTTFGEAVFTSYSANPTVSISVV